MHPDTTDELRALHESYVWRVNAAVAAGNRRLAEHLAQRYADEALQLLTAQAS